MKYSYENGSYDSFPRDKDGYILIFDDSRSDSRPKTRSPHLQKVLGEIAEKVKELEANGELEGDDVW